MKAMRWPFVVPYALLLACCAYFAGHDLFGVMFGIGESGGSLGFVAGAFLLASAFAALGFAIAALGAFSTMQVSGFLGFASAIFALPVAVLSAWQEVNSIISLSKTTDPFLRLWNQTHIWLRVESFLHVILDLAAMYLCWLRLRQRGRANSVRSVLPKA